MVYELDGLFLQIFTKKIIFNKNRPTSFNYHILQFSQTKDTRGTYRNIRELKGKIDLYVSYNDNHF